jgi:S1-C subfamily serine protease
MQDYGGYGGYDSTAPMPPMPPRPPRRRIGALSYVLVALAAGALGAGTVVALYHPASNNSASASPGSSAAAPAPIPSTTVPPPSSASPGTSVGQGAIESKVEPGLVIINTTLEYQSDEAAATGMVISSDGLVLTNNHVIEDSTSISATDLGNGHTYTAKVIGYDVTGDVALIQLQNASGLRTVPLGNSSTVKTGDSVLAMGNAEGQSQIVPAAGQVTALNQTITASDEGGTITSETLHGMIEDNADIVAGDSGGPLANSAGQVIGMDTAGSNGGGFGVQQQQQTSGFAIPINTALTLAHQMDAQQASSTVHIGYPPFMGVYIGQGSDSNPQAQEGNQEGAGGYGGGYGGLGGNSGNSGCYTSDRNLTDPTDIANVNSGTLILGVICGTAAESAGMTAGSVITAVNGQAVGSPDDLTSVVSNYKPGDTISVTWVSPSGKTTTSSLKLTDGPPL